LCAPKFALFALTTNRAVFDHFAFKEIHAVRAQGDSLKLPIRNSRATCTRDDFALMKIRAVCAHQWFAVCARRHSHCLRSPDREHLLATTEIRAVGAHQDVCYQRFISAYYSRHLHSMGIRSSKDYWRCAHCWTVAHQAETRASLGTCSSLRGFARQRFAHQGSAHA